MLQTIPWQDGAQSGVGLSIWWSLLSSPLDNTKTVHGIGTAKVLIACTKSPNPGHTDGGQLGPGYDKCTPSSPVS